MKSTIISLFSISVAFSQHFISINAGNKDGNGSIDLKAGNYYDSDYSDFQYGWSFQLGYVPTQELDTWTVNANGLSQTVQNNDGSENSLFNIFVNYELRKQYDNNFILGGSLGVGFSNINFTDDVGSDASDTVLGIAAQISAGYKLNDSAIRCRVYYIV